MIPDQLTQIATKLMAASQDRNNPLRQVTAATVDQDGFPQARTVVLRHFDLANRQASFHVDVRSPKFAQLQSKPAITLLWYDYAGRFQIRMRATAELHHMDGLAAERWQASQPMAKATYANPIGPSGEVDKTFRLAAAEEARHWSPEQDAAVQQNFCVVVCNITQIDYYQLAALASTRTLYSWQDGAWHEKRLAP